MAPSGIYPLLSQSWFGINELKKKRNYKRMRCFRGKENAACFQRGARGWPKNHEVKQQAKKKFKKKENEVYSCDCHPADEDAFPSRCSQHLSFPSQSTCSTNCLLIVFLDDSSSVPRICSRHVQCKMSFCDWIFVICNFSRPSQGKFVICDPALMWGICYL